MSTPLTDEQLKDIEGRDLGPLKADAPHNPDIRTVLADRKKLLAEVKRLRTQMAAVEKFCAARAEYITAINGCPPGNSVDYWRWQGHAEGRRHLSKELGLPVAWPTEYEQAEQVTP